MLYFHLISFLLLCLWRTQVSGQKLAPHQNAQAVQKMVKEPVESSSSSSAVNEHEAGVTALPLLSLAAVKRRPEADASGFYGDTFSGGFGEFETMKRAFPLYEAEKRLNMMLKRRPEMGATGFHGDTFAQGFGEFDTMKRTPYLNWMENVAKRRPEMTKSGFHGDVFNGGFGEFHPMRK